MTTFAPAAPAYRRVTGTPTWRAISRRHRVRLVETLEWISDHLRQKGEHGGPATHATIRVFRALLFRFANTATGGQTATMPPPWEANSCRLELCYSR